MTNFFSPTKKKSRRINPETALLAGPIVLGIICSMGLVFLVLIPSARNLYQSHSALHEAEKKVANLPRLRQETQDTLAEYSKRYTQHKRLFALLAGSQTTRTFLAEISRLANLEQVSVTLITPLAREIYIPPPPQPPQQSSAAPSVTPLKQDPLLAPNVESRSFTITFKAPYSRLILLLRKIEQLESLVVVKDSELKAFTVKAASPSESNIVELKVTLVSYGNVPKKD